MRATRMVKQLKNSSYEDRLKVVNLPTLKYKRLRGNMIQVYKSYLECMIIFFKFNKNISIALALHPY